MTIPREDENENIEPEDIDNIPPDATPQELLTVQQMAREPALRESGNAPRFNMQGGVVMNIVISAIVALVIIVGMGMVGGGSFVTKSDFEYNLSNMSTSINQMEADALIAQEEMSTAVSNIPSTIDTRVNDVVSQSISAINSDISTLKGQITSLQSQTQTESNRIGEILSNLNSIENNIETIRNSVEVLKENRNEYARDIDALENKIDGYSDDLAELSVAITALEELIVADGDGGGDGVITGDVIAVISGGYFTDQAYMVFPEIPHEESASSQFNIKLINNTGKTITNIKLAIALYIYDASQSLYDCSEYAECSMKTAEDLSILWIEEPTGYDYILGYINKVSSGVFDFGNITQDMGTTYYSQVFTVTNTSLTENIDSMMINPTVNVISYEIVE